MRRRNPKFDDLVVAVAMGATIKDWAKANGISYGTARNWSESSEFQAKVRQIRADVLDSYIGRLTGATGELADKLLDLARNGKSEAVRLSAIRGAVDDLIKMSGLAQIKAELLELHAKVESLESRDKNVVTPDDPERLRLPESPA
jgi:hypothetical protein